MQPEAWCSSLCRASPVTVHAKYQSTSDSCQENSSECKSVPWGHDLARYNYFFIAILPACKFPYPEWPPWLSPEWRWCSEFPRDQVTGERKPGFEKEPKEDKIRHFSKSLHLIPEATGIQGSSATSTKREKARSRSAEQSHVDCPKLAPGKQSIYTALRGRAQKY